MWTWLKHYMPKGLYGRVIAILLLPVLSVQAVVGVVFIQRHFESVTEQMTLSMVPVLETILDGAPAMPLGVTRQDGAPPLPPARRFYDLSGRVLTRVLTRDLTGLSAVNLSDPQRVQLQLERPDGLVTLSFDRARVSARNPHQLLVIMAVMGAVMTFVAYLYLRNQLRPIKRLGRAAEAYGRGQVVPLYLSGATEVRTTGAAFLEMRARLERQTASRRMMLTGISHDLRTPLTRMRLELSMMEAPGSAPLLGDVQEMEALIDTFLDYARDDASDAHEQVDAPELLRAAVQAAARLGPVTIGDMPSDLPPLHARPMALRRALDNLLSNALRYGTRARVSLARGRSSIQFIVEDDGPGIPAAQRGEAMRAFTRLDPSRNRATGGVGLGLAIVSDVARSHGGRLELDQSADLGGLKAVLAVPL